jgi:Uma2 family endonuclease
MDITHVADTSVLANVLEPPKMKVRRKLPLPLTFEERASMGKAEVRVAATFQEYLDLAHDCDYRVHFRNGQIISFIEIDEKTNTTMGEATITHERLVMRFGYFLAEIFGIDSDFQVLGSNIKIFIGEEQKGVNPDVAVVKGDAEIRTYKSNRRTSKGVANPFLIVEVLSKSTRDFDLSEKLMDYKLIPSLQQVIFAEQNSVWASTYIRVNANEWRNIDFTNIDDQIPVADGFISLAKLYSKMF